MLLTVTSASVSSTRPLPHEPGQHPPEPLASSRLARPTRHVRADGAPDERASSRGYRLAFDLRGPPGACALQRVAASIRYLQGEETLVAYRGRYWEYFRFAADGSLGLLHDGQPQVDVHAFDARDDGWGPGAVRRLLRERGVSVPAFPGGATRVVYRKDFLLGLGEVEGARPVIWSDDGGEFGYLERGPDGPARAALELTLPDEPTLALDAGSPFPLTRDCAAGSGRFVVERGWRATETFTQVLAVQRADLDLGGGYRSASLLDLPPDGAP